MSDRYWIGAYDKETEMDSASWLCSYCTETPSSCCCDWREANER